MTKVMELTDEQSAALQAFAASYGRESLTKGRTWAGESYKGANMGGKDSGTLRDIRNQFGPTWLVNFRFPKAESRS